MISGVLGLGALGSFTLGMVYNFITITADVLFKLLNAVKSVQADVMLLKQDNSAAFTADALFRLQQLVQITADVFFRLAGQAQITADTVFQLKDIPVSVQADLIIVLRQLQSLTADVTFVLRQSKILQADALFLERNKLATIQIETLFRLTQSIQITADVLFKLQNLTKTLTCDAIFLFHPWRTLTTVRSQQRARLLPSVRENSSL